MDYDDILNRLKNLKSHGPSTRFGVIEKFPYYDDIVDAIDEIQSLRSANNELLSWIFNNKNNTSGVSDPLNQTEIDRLKANNRSLQRQILDYEVQSPNKQNQPIKQYYLGSGIFIERRGHNNWVILEWDGKYYNLVRSGISDEQAARLFLDTL